MCYKPEVNVGFNLTNLGKASSVIVGHVDALLHRILCLLHYLLRVKAVENGPHGVLESSISSLLRINHPC